MKIFPIMNGEQVCGILWEAVKPYTYQALRNHQQSLDMLARRGGLDPLELWCVVNNISWRELISLGTPHKELKAIAQNCEQKLIDKFGDKLRFKNDLS
ncbi:hypothetical protein KAR91_22980 [Candidatus Pacearchaeota archaeon]|nr:hypothetical protein [Candidatus Pacearchaeota archaeon]